MAAPEPGAPALPVTAPLSALAGYPQHLRESVHRLIVEGRLGPLLRQRYPELHAVRNERALQDYVAALKSRYLRSAPPLAKIVFDNQIHVIRNALGTHTAISRVQGNKLKAKRELRIAAMFRTLPEAFLRMIVVHELAHLREMAHDKAFYQLCCHMEPDYPQLEFDLRCYLCWLEAGGAPQWEA